MLHCSRGASIKQIQGKMLCQYLEIYPPLPILSSNNQKVFFEQVIKNFMHSKKVCQNDMKQCLMNLNSSDRKPGRMSQKKVASNPLQQQNTTYFFLGHPVELSIEAGSRHISNFISFFPQTDSIRQVIFLNIRNPYC